MSQQSKKIMNSKVVNFQRDASYYFEKGTLYYKKNKLDKALMFFRKTMETEPENPLNHYNVACLLSKMGYLTEANDVFGFIVEKLDSSMTECYFLMAVNFGLLEDLSMTRNYLKKYLSSSPEGEMAFEAEELLEAISEEDTFYENFKYPKPEQKFSVLMEDTKNRLIKKFEESKDFRNTLFETLYGKDDDMSSEVIYLYGLIGNKRAEKIMREFARNPWVKKELKQLSLIVLKEMGAQEPYEVFLEGEMCRVNLREYSVEVPEWKDEWQEIINYTMENMKQSNLYEDYYFEDVQAIWIDYINAVYPDVPTIKKVETWAAGLEYALIRLHFLDLTQQQVANRYNVSLSSVSKKFKKINEVLKIDVKAYHNILKYLQEDDREED
ncbi:MAG: hypothetical protein D5R97_00650 [Candidatus Syntrophonatronum acetioxidans]|uniref:Uncharacterized protein n=1 Tax=Candidatus Syntrophonatronum acetioxidans TaxID=1795816 RepID=A0A424YIQ8_9FIRM|nr:MAG: hypothetical protein D5R97_00650 [Candidatus Syntrophonatronum acetioxidans]